MSALSVHHAAQVLCPPAAGMPYLRHDRAGELTTEPGGLWARDGRIAALAPERRAAVQVDATGGAVVPGFVDCHTHLPFAGWGGTPEAAARRFEAATDGGVLRQTREVAEEMLRHGTTAFDARGLYGLSPVQELRALRLTARLAVRQRVSLTAPVTQEAPEAAAMLPRVVAETRAQAVEAAEPSRIAEAGRLARSHDLWLRARVDRAGAAAAGEGARSVAGLAELGADDLAPLAAAECAAVLLPAADLLIAEHLPPARELADAGAICVLASGCDPAASPVCSLPLVLGLAARLYGWNAKEALLACTLNAAWATGMSDDAGTLEPGKRADLLVLDGPIEHLTLRFGRNPVAVVILGGEVAWVRPDHAWRVTRA